VSQATCPRCGEPLPANAKFCPNCGAPVSVPAASERRIVTVVFVDLADSTGLAARLDPERFREVLAAFHGMVTGEITWLRGRAESFIGDAVLGVFGIPVAHDDDAVRAIRAALAIVERSGRLGKELGLPMPMRVRIGVNTGPVAVGTATDRNLVIGSEVNVGARLQQGAEPGEVLVGPTTRELARDSVEFGPVRLLAAKGFEAELPVWPVVGLAPRTTRATIPLVDRRREIALLHDTFARVRDRERAHLVTLLGEPGIGKSRVIEEFLAQIEGATVLTGRSSAFEEDVTFWPIAQMVYQQIGEDPDAPTSRVLEALRDAAGVWVDPDEADRVAHRLALALGEGEVGTEENRYHAAEVRLGVGAMVEGLAAAGPVVLVFEDLHQSDPLLLDLIEQLMRDARRLPLLVLAAGRGELLTERPGWTGGLPDAITLWVESLTQDQAAELAREAGELGPDEARRVAAHAGGNPLFIIEITGMDRDGGAAGPRALPPTVQAVVAARLDELSPAARELVRRASVFPGGRFDLHDLELVSEPRRELLSEAEEQEILVRDPERAGVWRFRSDVLRDVAYESLAKRERQRLHLRVANRLLEPGTRDRYPRTIAYHLEQAALAALDLNPRDRGLAERAVEALASAGDIARRRVESRAAVDLYERALALAGPEETWGDREALILANLGESRYWLGAFDDAETTLRRALEVGGETSDLVCAKASRFLGDITLTIRSDDEEAAELFDRGLAAARRLGDPTTLARVLLMAAWVPYWRNDLASSRAMFQEALAVARGTEEPDPLSEVRALLGLASVLSIDDDERQALVCAEEALAIGRAAGQEFSVATAEEKVAASLRRMLRLDEALVHAERAVAGHRELGARWEEASALGEHAEILHASGRLEEAERELREVVQICHALKERSLLAWAVAELATIEAMRGDTVGARQTLEDPAARIATNEPGADAALARAEAVVAWIDGDRDIALGRSLAAIEASPPAQRNYRAADVWWTGRLFGTHVVGGGEALEEARATLEGHAWRQALAEPEALLRLDG
jgi:class 3 adenylate cyclase/tetratricopeptide (TPR) repeat protein